MKWKTSNIERPEKEGFYYTIDTIGCKSVTEFARNHWYSQTGHPIVCWLDESSPPTAIREGEIMETKNTAASSVEEIDTEFRSIISHALLGCDTSDIDKETWDLVFSECTKYCLKYSQAKEKEIEGLKNYIYEIRPKHDAYDSVCNTLGIEKDILGYCSQLQSQLTAKEAEIKDLESKVKQMLIVHKESEEIMTHQKSRIDALKNQNPNSDIQTNGASQEKPDSSTEADQQIIATHFRKRRKQK